MSTARRLSPSAVQAPLAALGPAGRLPAGAMPDGAPRLSDRLADALAGDIRAGRLQPGDRLPTEAVLAERHAVSRTVVREAVSRLKSLGLVSTRQGSGAFVREAGPVPLDFEAQGARSRAAVEKIVEVRRALEAEIAALAAQRRNARDVQALRAALGAIEQASAAGGDGVAEDVAFHRAIAQAADNPYLLSTLDYLQQFLRGATRVTRANEARRADFARQVRDEHAAIVRSIEQGDAAAARRAAHRHMVNAAKRIAQADDAFWSQQGVQLAQPLVQSAPPEHNPLLRS